MAKFKTNLHAQYETDEVLEAAGVEVPLGDNIFITVRSFRCPAVQEAHRRMQDGVKHLRRRNKELDPKTAKEMAHRLLAEHVIVGWRGLKDAEDNEIEFTAANARELLEELPHVADILADAAGNISTFQAQLDEEAEGN